MKFVMAYAIGFLWGGMAYIMGASVVNAIIASVILGSVVWLVIAGFGKAGRPRPHQ